jgi:hypothetical protein
MAKATVPLAWADIEDLLGAVPDRGRLIRAYAIARDRVARANVGRDAVATAEIDATLNELERLGREIQDLRAAGEVRWDRKTSAFDQADALAVADRGEWIASLAHLADMVAAT